MAKLFPVFAAPSALTTGVSTTRRLGTPFLFFRGFRDKHEGRAGQDRCEQTHIAVVYCDAISVTVFSFFSLQKPSHLCLILLLSDVKNGLRVEGLLCQMAQNVTSSCHPKDGWHRPQDWHNPHPESWDNLQTQISCGEGFSAEE